MEAIMRGTPLLSIIIPAYNVEHYIFRCLESISKQIYSNIEVIVVDDGSTDSTLEIIKTFCKRDSRFTFFTKENGGQMSAYLLALRYANGDYIGFVDPDDWIDKEMYNLMMDEILKVNADICTCEFRRIDANTNQIISEEKTEYKFVHNEAIKEIWQNVLPRPGHSSLSMSRVNKIFKRKIIFDNIKYCEMDISRIMEDRRLVPACLWSASSIIFLGKPLYNVCVNRSGSTSRKYVANLLDIISTIHHIHKTALVDKGLFELCKDEFKYSLIDFARIYLLRNVFNVKDKKIKLKSCDDIINSTSIREAVLDYKGKVDKTLLALKISMILRSKRLLFAFCKFSGLSRN